MLYPDKKIESLADLIKNLKKDSESITAPIWFRGQSQQSYKLVPSYFRHTDPPSERTLIKTFKQNASLLVNNVSYDDFAWLFIMQHHGVPTRLLDWSESPFVALYFACCSKPNDDGYLWMLLPVSLNVNASIRPDEPFDIPSIHDDALLNYSPVRYYQEKTSSMLPVATICQRNTERMQAQLGTFVLYHRDKQAIEEIGDKKHVWRYKISKDSKTELIKELQVVGFNKFHLFPELSSIGEMIKARI